MIECEPHLTSLEQMIDNRSARIVVVGLGHVGFPTSMVLAHAGFAVTGVDADESLVERLNNGHTHFNEPDLHQYHMEAIRSARFRATTQITDNAEIYIIAVPTPVTSEKQPELKAVKSVTETIAQRLEPGNMVVIESTVPPRTCEKILAPIIFELSQLRHGEDYDLVYCPERAMPGRMLVEVVQNNRTVGGTTRSASERAARLYRTFVSGGISLTNTTTAELCKLMENTYRDVNIALANEFSLVCEHLGIDVHETIALANKHPRVNIHQPGIGVGGQCIPKDPWFIVAVDGADTSLIQMARKINDQMPIVTANRIERHLEKDGLKRPGATIGIVGLTFKPDVDDFRDSPAISVARELQRRGYRVSVWDPWLSDKVTELQDLNFQNSNDIKRNDLVIELVKHTLSPDEPNPVVRASSASMGR